MYHSQTILRRPEVQHRTGLPRSTLYALVSQGLFSRPLKIAKRASGWPAHEVDAINAARIAGDGEDRIRQLVRELEACRTELGTKTNC